MKTHAFHIYISYSIVNVVSQEAHQKWLNNYKDSQVLFYRRYVYDTICLFHNEQDAMFLRSSQF